VTESFEIGGEFFELTLDGKNVKVRSGPVGTKGKIHKLSYPNPDRAQLEFDKLVEQKRAAASSVPAAAAAPLAESAPPAAAVERPAELPAEPTPAEPATAEAPTPTETVEATSTERVPAPVAQSLPAAEATPPAPVAQPVAQPAPDTFPTEDPAQLLALPPEQRTSLIHRPAREKARNVKKVPFVELHGNRLQGVVSSGSDPARVYVAFVEAGTFNFCCSTNNNRPCGGLSPAMPCSHIHEVLSEAMAQYGDEEVVAFLGVKNFDPNLRHNTYKWFSDAGGTLTKEPPGTVFSRFLSYLSYCELEARPGACREMAWFPEPPATLPAGSSGPLPAGLAESSALIAGLDRCLMNGFTRLGPSQHEALQTLAALYEGTPLNVTPAVDGVARSEFLTIHFVTLAKARAALLGAQHDALHAQACAEFGLVPVDAPEPPAAPAGAHSTLLAGAQQWLMELALAGFEHLEESSVAPFETLLGQLQSRPELTGPAALLTGFYRELLRGEPRPHRWGDLWMACLVGTEHLLGESFFQEVSGSFIPWGLDVQSHENFLSASVYGLFQGERAVRIPLATWKVDLVGALELVPQELLQCVEGPCELEVEGELTSHGDLLARKLTLKDRVNPFDHPIPQLPRCPAQQRHPVQLALPFKGRPPVPLEDWSELPKGDEFIVLLRFDGGGWRFKPVTVLTKKGPVCNGHHLLKLRAKKKNPTLELLRERASRLLRS